MTKRSALAIAGGVVAAVIAAGFAVVVNLGVLQASTASTGPGNLRAEKPVVKTVEEVVTIHKKAKGPKPNGVRAIQTADIPAGPSDADDDAEYDDDFDGSDDEAQDDEDDFENEDEEHEYGEADDD